MILVHTLFVLSVIAGFGSVVAADTSTVKEAPTEPPKPEPPKDAPKPEVEKKVEANDGARTVAAKMLKEGVETSGDKIISDESLNTAVDKIVDIIHSERSVNPKAEALPLSLGEKFDFLLLKIPKIGVAKKEEEPKKAKEEEKTGARGLSDGTNPCNNCNNNCPCLQQNAPTFQPPTEPASMNSFNPTLDYVDPNCPQAQQQALQQQQLLQQQQQQYAAQLMQAYRASLGLNDYDQGSRALDGMGNVYAQPTYTQTVPNNDYYGYPNNYYNNRLPYFPGSLDAYGTPYPLIASLYPEAQHGYSNNNIMPYGYHKH
uniref:Elongation factor 1-alpha n=4 Tax=Lygus hesperus TaxID=30085 RepID=A0A0A9YXK6_LYGHE